MNYYKNPKNNGSTHQAYLLVIGDQERVTIGNQMEIFVGRNAFRAIPLFSFLPELRVYWPKLPMEIVLFYFSDGKLLPVFP